MRRTLADAKFTGSLPHCGVVLNNIPTDFHRALFNIIFQGKIPLFQAFYQTMQAGHQNMTVFQIPLTVYPEGVRLRADQGKRILPNIFRGALYTMNTKTKKILLWALSAFLFLTFFAALAQGVFAAAVFALIAGLSCNPLVQDCLLYTSRCV